LAGEIVHKIFCGVFIFYKKYDIKRFGLVVPFWVWVGGLTSHPYLPPPNPGEQWVFEKSWLSGHVFPMKHRIRLIFVRLENMLFRFRKFSHKQMPG
jgi:hypothetical protein